MQGIEPYDVTTTTHQHNHNSSTQPQPINTTTTHQHNHMQGIEPFDVTIPVIGGHAGGTILPLLSQVGVWHCMLVCVYVRMYMCVLFSLYVGNVYVD